MAKDLKVGTGASGGYSPGSYWKESRLGKVNVDDDEDLEKWAQVLGMSKSDLLLAVQDFGPIVRDIRRGLLHRNDEAA